MEIWKPIKGHEGFHEISNKGRVRSVDRLVNGRWGKHQFVKGTILNPVFDKDGYLKISLRKNGKRIYRRMHRLIAEAFIPNPENKPLINHINEIKDDNRLDNLEWCTPKENNNHGTCIQRRSLKKMKPVLMMDKNGNVIKKYEGAVMTELDGFNRNTVGACCRGINKTHRGYKWKFDDG